MPARSTRLPGRVINVEYGGRDSLVDVRTAGGRCCMSAARSPLRIGDDRARVVVPVERALVYPVQ